MNRLSFSSFKFISFKEISDSKFFNSDVRSRIVNAFGSRKFFVVESVVSIVSFASVISKFESDYN